MAGKNKGGRPTVVTQEVLRKLEEAFAMDCTDLEACLFADISKTTLYKYQDENPMFAERKAELKQTPFLIARRTIIGHLNDNYANAVDYMSRKKKDEFASRQEHTGPGGLNLFPIPPEDSQLSNEALHGLIGSGNSE